MPEGRKGIPKEKAIADAMDWSAFEGEPKNTCYCRCGEIFRSHSKINMNYRCTIARDPCPNCGTHMDLWKSSTDPEVFTIRG